MSEELEITVFTKLAYTVHITHKNLYAFYHGWKLSTSSVQMNLRRSTKFDFPVALCIQNGQKTHKKSTTFTWWNVVSEFCSFPQNEQIEYAGSILQKVWFRPDQSIQTVPPNILEKGWGPVDSDPFRWL